MRKVLTLGFAATALASCAQPKQLYSDHAWVRLGAVQGRPAAAYLNIHGGPTPATLISITTDVAIKSEMHETMQQGTMASMKAVPRIAIPANGVVKFEPGGRHVGPGDVLDLRMIEEIHHDRGTD